MKLGKYGQIVKRNLKEIYPMRYDELIVEGTIMDKLLEREQEIVKIKEIITQRIKEQNPVPKTNEFLIIAQYNQMIENLVEEQLQPMLEEKI